MKFASTPSARHTRIALSALALAALAAGAQAQQVVVFGVLDAGITTLSASGAKRLTLLNTDGNTSSRFGVRGSEDLGSGLKASFWIESAVSPDTGTSGGTSSNNIDSVSGGFTWGRRATLSLQGTWGELRLGRDYVPSFTNLTTVFHPFGTNGVGNAGLMFYQVNAGGTTVRTNVRASNSIGYHLPASLGGVYGTVMLARGEQPGGTATSDNGNLAGIRLGYRSGPFNVSGAVSKTNYATGDYTQSNVGASYQFGPAKLMALWGRNEVGVTKTTAFMVGTQWKLGGGEVRAAYTRLKASGVASDANHLALGYVYDLSKRTALYTAVARIDNKGNGTRFNVGLSPVTAGGSSSGAEVGVRHSF